MRVKDSPLYQIDSNPEKASWEEARRALHHVVTDWKPHEETEEEIQEVLYRRTRLLARPARGSEALADVQRVLTFTLGAEHYAVPVTCVQIIDDLKQLAPVPCTPSFYVGVVNVRGKIISVLELRLLFGIPIDNDTERAPRKLVIVRANGLEISLLSHEVSGVIDLARSDLSAPSEVLVGINPDYIAGTTAEGTILLDIDALLSDTRLIVEEGVI